MREEALSYDFLQKKEVKWPALFKAAFATAKWQFIFAQFEELSDVPNLLRSEKAKFDWIIFRNSKEYGMMVCEGVLFVEGGEQRDFLVLEDGSYFVNSNF